jgi:hypothetical protein
MVKKVFSNSGEVCHIWAQQNQPEGRSSNCYFNGETVYSYGNHYPLGIILTNKHGERAAVINAAGYSVTTTKHISQARSATSHYKQFSIAQTELMSEVTSAQRETLDIVRLSGAVSRYAIERCDYFARSLTSDDAKRRKAATIEKWRGEAISDVQSAIDVLTWVGGKIDAKARKAVTSLAGNLVLMREAAEKQRAAEARKREKARKAAALANAEFIKRALPAWLEGVDYIDGRNTSNALWEHHSSIFMRVKGDEVQTSKGARFPLDHGLKALPLIRAIVARGETWQRNGKTIHLGNYQIDTIGDGVIVAGCHTLPISEVERLAATLGV